MREEDLPDLRKELGRKLAILRESRDLSQAELARKARITASSLSQYEAGKKMPQLATLFRLLEALDYGLAALDRVDEFCLSLRLAPRRRPGTDSSLGLAAEAGMAVGRLKEALTFLARPESTSERVRALARAEGYPLPEDRDEAAELWERLRKHPREVWRALVAESREFHIWSFSEPRLWLCARHNRMWCLTTAGRHQEAEELLPEVKDLSRKLGKELDLIRLRWAEGRIAVGLGRTQQGIDLLTQVRAEFVSRKIWFDAGLVTLELAVVFLRQSRTDMVKTLAVHMAPIFNANGVHREALAALTLFRRAAEQEKVTLGMAERLVAYLRKARHDPALKFEEEQE